MSDNYAGLAITVQDLANELQVYYATAESKRHPWPRYVCSLWSKTFMRSSWGQPSPPMPEDLVEQVTGLDPVRAVTVIVGRALATVSGRHAAKIRTQFFLDFGDHSWIGFFVQRAEAGTAAIR